MHSLASHGEGIQAARLGNGHPQHIILVQDCHQHRAGDGVDVLGHLRSLRCWFPDEELPEEVDLTAIFHLHAMEEQPWPNTSSRL